MTRATAATAALSATPAPAGFTVRRIPQTAPRVISADEAWHGEQPYAQDALALDFLGARDDEDFGRQPTRSSQLPDPAPLGGPPRPGHRRGGLGAATGAAAHPAHGPDDLLRHRPQAMVAGRRRRAPGAHDDRAVVRRVRVCEPADGIVEACAVVVSHGRVRALALRLEGLDGRWLVTGSHDRLTARAEPAAPPGRRRPPGIRPRPGTNGPGTM